MSDIAVPLDALPVAATGAEKVAGTVATVRIAQPLDTAAGACMGSKSAGACDDLANLMTFGQTEGAKQIQEFGAALRTTGASFKTTDLHSASSFTTVPETGALDAAALGLSTPSGAAVNTPGTKFQTDPGTSGADSTAPTGN